MTFESRNNRGILKINLQKVNIFWKNIVVGLGDKKCIEKGYFDLD